MTTLQTDILSTYNSLVDFSKTTVDTNFPMPIEVSFDTESRALIFKQRGISVYLHYPIYYSLGLDSLLKPTYLLPEDYDYLMYTLQTLISSGELIKDRVCISPENYGFDIYSINLAELHKGPSLIGKARFVSGTSWFFKYWTRKKYKL